MIRSDRVRNAVLASKGSMMSLHPCEPISKRDALKVLAENIFRWWANCRAWMLGPEVTVQDVARAFRRTAEDYRERDSGAARCGFVEDAVAWGRGADRLESIVACLETYPDLWPPIQELLRDEDYETWDARVEALLATFPQETV